MKNRQGQTAVIILLIMIVALSIGVTISSRYVATLHNIATTDDSAKAVSIAEAAVERILLIPTETLGQYITNNSCGSNCLLQIVDTNGQRITANVTLSYSGNSTQPYLAQLATLSTREVSLQGYPSGSSVNVCWNGAHSVTGMYLYTNGTAIGATPFAYNAASTTHLENNFSLAGASGGYQSCFIVTTSKTPNALRLKSVYGDVDAYVVPSGGNTIPSQGILIVSTGAAGVTRKTVTVTKTSPSLPAVFDYVLYQKSDTEPLSN